MTEPSRQKARREIYWTTVTYKTVVVYSCVFVAVALGVWYLLSPGTFLSALNTVTAAITPESGVAPPPTVNEARFVNLEGGVQVKKRDSTNWVSADPGMTLDKGDLIRTTTDGFARISFPDGTLYTVKQDTLITVEENTMAQDRSTRVDVKISSGAVDLSTGSWEAPGSSAQVTFANAVAKIEENSRASVRSDPTKNQHEITLTAGGAELSRGGEVIPIAQFDRVTFPTDGPVTRSKVLAPPELLTPLNLAPLIAEEPKREAIRFEWKAVAGARHYQIRISKSSLFTQIVHQQRTGANSAVISGLEAGDYFWNVTATDAQNRSSEPSNTYKFILAAKGKGQEMFLEIEGTRTHGNVVEVWGRTEPGATIIINGQTVPNVKPDGSFQHFTPPLSRGAQKIVVVGQNRRGGTNKVERTVLIP